MKQKELIFLMTSTGTFFLGMLILFLSKFQREETSTVMIGLGILIITISLMVTLYRGLSQH